MIHDIHIHTSLSSCASRDASLAGYTVALRRAGAGVAGFSDHLWDNAVSGASSWYAPQDIEHVLPFKEAVCKASSLELKLYFGCETEYTGNGKVGLHRDHAELFDYVLIPHNHFHMAGFTRPAELAGAENVAELLQIRFLELCDYVEFDFSFVHPFTPLGYMDMENDILKAINDSNFEKCFRAAASRGASIEFNCDVLKNIFGKPQEEQYCRMFTIGCGCRFHLGSDAHRHSSCSAERYRQITDFASRCGAVLPGNPIER